MEPKKPKRSIFYYYAMMMLFVMLLNVLVFPSMLERQTVEITYSKFEQMLDKNEIKTVNLDNDKIAIEPKKKDDRNIYVTGNMNDPELIEKLNAKMYRSAKKFLEKILLL